MIMEVKQLTLTLLLSLCVTLGKGQADTGYIHIYGSNGIEKGEDLIATPDSGFILLGSTGSNGGNASSAYILKTDSLGDPLWSKTVGSVSVDRPTACSPASDSGFVFAGFTDRNIQEGYNGWLVKCDRNGSIEWERTYGGDNWDRILDVCAANDSGYVMVGETYENGDGNVWILRTDDEGDTLWTKNWGKEDHEEIAHAVTKSTDSSYTLTGATQDTSGTSNIFLFEIKDNGDSLWSKTYPDTAHERGLDVIATQDGGRALFGETSSYSDGDMDQFFLETDDTGAIEAFDLHGGTAFYGHASSEDDGGRSLVQIGANEILTVGWTETYGEGKKDMDFRRLNAGGGYKFSANFFSPKDEVLNSIITTSYQTVAAVGWTESETGNGRSDIVLLLMDTIDSDPYDKTIVHSNPPVSLHENQGTEKNNIKIHPNPFKNGFQVQYRSKGLLTYEIYNMKGKRLRRGTAFPPLNIQTPDLRPGTYLLRVRSDSGDLRTQELLIKE